MHDWMIPIELPITHKPIIEKEIKNIGICVASSSFFFFFFFVSYSALFFVGFFLLTREQTVE